MSEVDVLVIVLATLGGIGTIQLLLYLYRRRAVGATTLDEQLEVLRRESYDAGVVDSQPKTPRVDAVAPEDLATLVARVESLDSWQTNVEERIVTLNRRIEEISVQSVARMDYVRAYMDSILKSPQAMATILKQVKELQLGDQVATTLGSSRISKAVGESWERFLHDLPHGLSVKSATD